MTVQIDRYARKLYAAEGSMPKGEVFPTMLDCRLFVSKVVDSEFWKTYCDQPYVAVLSTKSTKWSYAKQTKADIYLSAGMWNEATIIHELTHILVLSRHGSGHGHDGLFVYWLFRLVSHFLGAEAGGKLLEGFAKQGIEFDKDRNLALFENKGRTLSFSSEQTKSDYVPFTYTLSKTHIPVARVHEMVVAKGLSLSSFAKAFGGNRVATEPINEHWIPVYADGKRWLPRTCLTRLETDLKPASPRAGQPRRSIRSKYGY